MGDEAPTDVEEALEIILSHVDTDTMNPSQRVSVERKCQAIHALFGGTSPDQIYPDE